MAIITDKDVFDFDGYKASMQGLIGITTDMGQSTVSWLTRIQTACQATLKDIAETKTGLAGLSVTSDNADKKVVGFITRLAQSGQQLEIARRTQASLSDAQKINSHVVDELSKKLADLFQRYDALDSTQKDYTKQQRVILGEVKTVTRAIDAQSKSLQVGKSVMDAAEGSFNAFKQQTSALKKQLDALPGAYDKGTGKINEQNRAAVALSEQYQKNINLINKINAGQLNFRGNVGNYPQATSIGSSVISATTSAASGFAGAGLAMAGLDSTMSAIQKVSDIVLQFDSLDSALKVVSNDTWVLIERQAMLAKVSDDLGQDLSLVEQQYTNLTASSKGTRLEGEATDKIFESIVGTMGRLKKPSEQTERALLAVGQMISKNVIASEELRGQLAEVLPGSFNIAAKAMGVTTAQLSKMLKDGKVVASDFLPKFAAELEKTFNPNHEQRVEGLAANLARLRNESVEWVKSLNIADTAGEWIGDITSMARAVRQFFAPAILTATQNMADQAETVAHLESELPGLLSRYDELKSKAKLTGDEQRELHTVVNSLVTLVPSAATGFDSYGNALDVNKSKVLAFTQAQRDLNAELNKATIKALRDQTSGGFDRIDQTTNTLNRGTRQQSFNFTPFFLRSAKERQQATSADAGQRREVALTDDERRQLQTQLQEQNRQVELTITQRLQLGDKLDQATIYYIEHSGSTALKQYKIISDYNDKIAELTTKQADLLLKGDKASLAQRETVLKQLKEYEDKKKAILNPTLTANTALDSKGAPSQTTLDKQLRESLSKTKAANELVLNQLRDDRQDGLIDEQTFIEKQLQLTLKGADERLALLRKAGKQETDDYAQVLSEKQKAYTAYSRSQLKLDLQANQGKTQSALSALDPSSFAGGENDLSYIEQRHKIIENGLKQEQTILQEAGQQNSELNRKNNQDLLDEQKDYLKRRLKVEKVGWNQQLTDTKEALKQIDDSIAAELDNQLQQLEKGYNQSLGKIQVSIAKGKITPEQGDLQVFALEMEYLKDQQSAIEMAYAKDRALSDSLIEDKIEGLKNLRDYGMKLPVEVEDINDQIRKLEKARDDDAAADKKKNDKDVADNKIAQSKRSTEQELKDIDKAKKKRQTLWELSLDLANTIGQTITSISQSYYQKDLDNLEKQHEQQLLLVGDNADAKAKIDADYAKQKADLSRKAAIQEREAALFSIAIDTAKSVMSVLSTGGGTHYLDAGVAAGILSAFVIATGLAQAAAVLAEPMPSYKSGKKSSDPYSGIALAGEAGSELWVNFKGESQLLTKPTLINTQRGDTIYTASETGQILADIRRGGVAQRALDEIAMLDQTSDRLELGRMQQQVAVYQLALKATPGLSQKDIYQAFGKALDERPVNEMILDEKGIRRRERRGNHVHEYLNNRHRH